MGFTGASCARRMRVGHTLSQVSVARAAPDIYTSWTCYCFTSRWLKRHLSPHSWGDVDRQCNQQYARVSFVINESRNVHQFKNGRTTNGRNRERAINLSIPSKSGSVRLVVTAAGLHSW